MIAISKTITMTSCRIELLELVLSRTGIEASARLSLMDSDGAIQERRSVNIPDPVSFISRFIPDYKAIFDAADEELLTALGGTGVTANDDVTLHSQSGE